MRMNGLWRVCRFFLRVVIKIMYMKELKFAVFGCGFWSQFQIGAWSEIPGVRLCALYNRTVSKAEVLSKRFGNPRVYGDAEELLANEDLDFVDIITDVDTHCQFVLMAARAGVKHIICQKPMAPDFRTAQRMVEECERYGAQLYVHDNYRWQAPVRRFKEILDSGVIGRPFNAKIYFQSSYPVFDNQPFLRELDRFILTDMGSHVFDIGRFLFGEAESLWCQMKRVTPGICGEDFVAVMLRMTSGLPLYVEMSYASIVPHDTFSTVNIEVEGDRGTLSLGPGTEFRICTTTREGSVCESVEFPSYSWADPDYIVNHESGIHINRDILRGICGEKVAENTGRDNLETVRLVWASYASAEMNRMILLESFK